MRRECVNRNSGAPRALAAGIAPTQLSVRPSSPEKPPNSTGTVYRARPVSGSLVCGETATSLPAPATPQQCPAAAGDFVWPQRVEQHRRARMVCVLRAGAPYATWTLNAVSATRADAMSRFTDTGPLDDPSRGRIQAVGPPSARAS